MASDDEIIESRYDPSEQFWHKKQKQIAKFAFL